MRFSLLSQQFNLVIATPTSTVADNISGNIIYCYLGIRICNWYEKSNKFSNI